MQTKLVKSLPAVIGNVRFENIKFRFGDTGPYQLNGVNIEIPAGSFVGIVGQSGSGKHLNETTTLSIQTRSR